MIQNGHLDVLKYLLNEGADIHAVTSISHNLLNIKNSANALHVAAYHGRAECVLELLNHGLNPYVLTQEDELPIDLAIMKGQYDAVEAMLDYGMDMDFLNSHEFPPAFLAVLKDQVEILRLLVRYGADVNARSMFSTAPIFRVQSAEAVEALVEFGVDVNSRDKRGTYPLSRAARRGYTEAVEALIVHGATMPVDDGIALLPTLSPSLKRILPRAWGGAQSM